MLPELLTQLQNAADNQSEVNKMYDKLVHFILDEVASSVQNQKPMRKSTVKKPYWDLELSRKWKLMCKSEKAYCKKKQKVKIVHFAN